MVKSYTPECTEEAHKLLFFNQRCRETSRGKAAVGVKCHEVWPEVCSNCPLDAMGEKSSGHIVCHDPVLKTTVDGTANRGIWDDHIRAVGVTVSPHRMNFEERQGAVKIQRSAAPFVWEGEKTDIQTVPASNGQGHIPYGRIYSGTDRTGQ